jgi:hypothetical protein
VAAHKQSIHESETAEQHAAESKFLKEQNAQLLREQARLKEESLLATQSVDDLVRLQVQV